ncbi:MAG: hypothetical protein ACHQX3_00325 [Nitrospirales bacterium]
MLHDEIADRLDNAAPNIRMGRIALEQLSDAEYNTEAAQECLDEYDGMKRADFDSAEEYRDERQEAWDELVTAIREMEAPESEDGAGEDEAPTVEVVEAPRRRGRPTKEEALAKGITAVLSGEDPSKVAKEMIAAAKEEEKLPSLAPLADKLGAALLPPAKEKKTRAKAAPAPAPPAPVVTTAAPAKKSRWTPLDPSPEDIKAAQANLIAAFTK